MGPLGMTYTWRGCRSPWGWPTRGGAVGPPGDGLHVAGMWVSLGMAYTWRGCRSPWGWPTRGGDVGLPGDGLHVAGL